MTTHDIMAISDRIVCVVQSDKKYTLHPAAPSNEKAQLQGGCKQLQKPPANPYIRNPDCTLLILRRSSYRIRSIRRRSRLVAALE